MRKQFFLATILLIGLYDTTIQAQSVDTTTVFKPHGTLWGLTFGDYIYKVNADTVSGGLGRGNNQYSKIPAGTKFFQFRRIYLGYTYDLSPKFTAEVLLAAESDQYTGSVGNQSNQGDVLEDNKFAPFVKLANIRWKNFFKGTDLVMGECYTPAFPLLSEYVWGYRSIERTVADMRGTPSYDEGFSLQGHYGNKTTFGYNLMVGNGTSAVPENSPFPMYYGDVWAKLFGKRIIIDLYQDYRKLKWENIDTAKNGYHQDRNTTKLLIAYTTPIFTVGIETMQTTLLGDVEAETLGNRTFYNTTFATSVSTYIRGRVYKDKAGFFIRYDNYNPSHDLSEVYDNKRVIDYQAQSSSYYDPTTKEKFLTFGLDLRPLPNVHIMPNFYLNTYTCALPSKDYGLNNKASGVIGTDAVYRLTIYYIFGKSDGINY